MLNKAKIFFRTKMNGLQFKGNKKSFLSWILSYTPFLRIKQVFINLFIEIYWRFKNYKLNLFATNQKLCVRFILTGDNPWQERTTFMFFDILPPCTIKWVMDSFIGWINNARIKCEGIRQPLTVVSADCRNVRQPLIAIKIVSGKPVSLWPLSKNLWRCPSASDRI